MAEGKPTPCGDCVTGPLGVAGHDRLFSHTISGDEMHFLCRGCGSSWARTHSPKGDFAWRAIDAPLGRDVPGRPGTMPP